MTHPRPLLLKLLNEAFRHVETLFVQGNKVCTESKQKPPFLLPKKEVCFDSYELDYLG